MDEKDKQDINVGVVLHVSQEDAQSTESDIKQETALSPVCATCPVPASIPGTSCSCDCKILKKAKCEHKLSESMHEGGSDTDSQKAHSVDDRIVSGLQGVKCEKQRQELNEQRPILPSVNSLQASTLSYDVNELTEVKLEKTEPDEHDINSDETRHWIVCPGGVLKEVKADPTIDVSDILRIEDVSHNVDQKQLCGGSNHAKMERESQPNAHQRTHHGVKPLTCYICGKSFAFPSLLKIHERSHTGVKPRTCYICGKSFAFSYLLKTHMGVKTFTCDTCGKSFTHAGTLVSHERIHSGVKPLTRNTCGKSFAFPSLLKIHERSHTGVKACTCDICGKSFIKPSKLKIHERTHTGVKPYTCDTCGKSFVKLCALKRHEMTHTGVKPYMCDVCGRLFAQMSNLRVHERTHTGVKPYTCDMCGKSFAYFKSLAVHEITHTGVNLSLAAYVGNLSHIPIHS